MEKLIYDFELMIQDGDLKVGDEILVFCKFIVNYKCNTLIYYIIRMCNFNDVRGCCKW